MFSWLMETELKVTDESKEFRLDVGDKDVTGLESDRKRDEEEGTTTYIDE